MPSHQFLAMHIPDGFLSLPVALAGWVLLVVPVGIALRQTRAQFSERQIPLMGILGAFVFAAQMINFPVAGGTSGHLLGGTLVAILVGPWGALLVMTSVIATQALLFQDGGLLALGFNAFNMGILAAFIGYAVYAGLGRALSRTPHGDVISAAVAAWISVEVAATAVSLQLVASGTSSPGVALPAMVGVHALIGIGEAMITVGALAFIRQARPDLLDRGAQVPAQGAGWVAAGLVVALALAFASPLASSHPDGLERVAADKGFIDKAKTAVYQILPDYTVPGIDNQDTATIVAGVVGVLVVAGLSYGAARWIGRADLQSPHDHETAQGVNKRV